MTAHLYPSVPRGVATAPPSKSMAHRLLICAALCQGPSLVQNLDASEDICATVTALRQLGATVNFAANQADVCGSGGFSPAGPIHCGKSATTLRLLLPLSLLGGARQVFTGAPGLLRRPMGVYRQLLGQRGLLFRQDKNRIVVEGRLPPGHYVVPGHISSQFISGLLLALPLLAEDSRIEVQAPFESSGYVEMTRQAQALFGVQSHWQENVLHIPGRQRYCPGAFTVEGDWSLGAVLLLMSALNGDIALRGLPQETQQGDAAILTILQACGCSVEWEDGGLRVGALCRPLFTPAPISLSACPDLGPLLCVLGLFCNSPLTLTQAGRLRIKESDRAAAMAQTLAALGGKVQLQGDGITVAQGAFPISGQHLHAFGDHRVAMALAAAAVGAGLELAIEGAEAVRKSWPAFFEMLQELGVSVVME